MGMVMLAVSRKLFGGSRQVIAQTMQNDRFSGGRVTLWTSQISRFLTTHWEPFGTLGFLIDYTVMGTLIISESGPTPTN